MQFRLHRRLALTLGFMPFSSVGYSISTEEKIKDTPNPNLTAYSTYNGSGGLNQLFLGAGFKVFNGLSVGVNASYLFGTITHSSQVSFSDNSFNMSNKTNSIRVQDYKLDFGLQYTQKIGQKQNVTLGALAPVDTSTQLAGEILFNIIKPYCCLCVPPLRLLINYNLPPRAASVLAVCGDTGKFFIIIWYGI